MTSVARKDDQWPSQLRCYLEEGEGALGVRKYVEAGRKRLFDWHRAGVSGTDVVVAYGQMVDLLLRHLFETAQREYLAHYPTLSERCTMIAQGGYGREELNPYSDIDLLFLYGWTVTPYVEFVTEKVLYALWDGGLQVGHATRDISSCMRLAERDLVSHTTMIDSRYLAGDETLYAEFAAALESRLAPARKARFVRQKLAEYHKRHQQYGESVFLLEPDIKEGQGGLRDVHTSVWIARAQWGVKSLREFASAGLLSERDLEILEWGVDFLWRVRNELHFLCAKHQDQLTFELQERVAPALGFAPEENLRAVETFMRAYYLHAAEVSRVSGLVIHRAMAHSPHQDREKISGHEIRPGLRISKRTLALSSKATDTLDAAGLVEIFAVLQKYRVEMGQDSRELLRARVETLGKDLCRSREANAALLRILRAKDWIYETLLEMHRCNVLDALVPEFGRLRCMALHDLYHIYTVDQHLMRAVREFERLKAGEFKETLPLLSQLAREADRVEVLILGILFHDIGKGQGGGHSEIGRDIVLRIAQRLEFNFDDTELLSFLVLHHLLLTGTAFRRDIEDEKVVQDLAQAVQSTTNLKLLYLLTYSDMRAVGPDVWNNWKASLLQDLVSHTLHLLEQDEKGERETPNRTLRVQRIQARILERLAPEFGEDAVRRFFLDAMPERYFLNTPEEEMPFHFRLLRRLKGERFFTAVRHRPADDYTELVVCAKDQPGLFASITGVLVVMGLDILSARIHTRRDGLILDVFRISHLGCKEVVMEPGRWSRMELTLDRVLKGEVDVAELVAKSGRPFFLRRSAPRVPTLIEVDNDASDDFTIIEVYTQDRMGILFTIAYRLYQLGLSIYLAKISTNVDQVADVFYVADDETGGKIEDRERLARVQHALCEELAPSDERLAQSAD